MEQALRARPRDRTWNKVVRLTNQRGVTHKSVIGWEVDLPCRYFAFAGPGRPRKSVQGQSRMGLLKATG